jgi:class 3 adenylate cyclase/tetratricopeptide (TPR) repeat protein
MERKLATVLFVDLVESTELVARMDPEVVRRRVTRFFDDVSVCVTTHGGIVEKFAGDAVMAAFGVPLAHEDDAERAARAALAILDKVHALGLEARIGVEAGEVVVDDGESTFATGEAVNLAARLQQAAVPGEILIGPGAARLTDGTVEVEPGESLELRGFPEPVQSWRVVATCAGGRPMGSLHAPLVGRDEELELLETTFSRAVRHRRPTLVTLYGEPGVGKSRLAREFVASLDDALVLSGRCLPYGMGVTYWPLAEMVKSFAGITDDDPLETAQEKLQDCCENEAVADLLALAAGVLEAVEGERSPQEIAWAARALAEQLAQAQPLVLVFEDVHWGEEPLLDLVEHLAAWVKAAPLLILCLARPELLDVRPTWGGGRVRGTTIELEPLPADDAVELVRALVAERELPFDVEAVLAKTEGNPLFVEETIRMLVEQDGHPSQDRIPDTLQALIAARVDRLPPAARTVLQRASVIGRVFWGGAIAHLSPELDEPQHALDELILRDLVVSEPRSPISGQPAFKFKHVLIREVAYTGLSKAARAEHHALFAEWLGMYAGDEIVEIRAFHLDRAAHLHAELDGAPPPELAEEAAAALTKAGHRALSREAFRTARKLLLRANELSPTLDRRYLAARAAWRLADLAAVRVEMAEVQEAAARNGDRALEGRALTALAEAALYQRGDAAEARALANAALEALGDDQPPGVRFETLWTLSQIAGWQGDNDAFEHWAKLALETARGAGRKDLEATALNGLASSYLQRLEISEAEPLVARAAELAEESGSVVSRAAALNIQGWLENTKGRPAESEAAFAAARDLYGEIGNTSREATLNMMVGRRAIEQGAIERGEKLLRDAVRTLKGLGDRAQLCEAQRSLAQLLLRQGRVEEAERYALEARETVGPEDRVSLSTTKLALGQVRAAQGRDEEAERLLREALAELREYQLYVAEREALRALIQFLRERGRDDEAAGSEDRLAALVFRSTAPIA